MRQKLELIFRKTMTFTIKVINFLRLYARKYWAMTLLYSIKIMAKIKIYWPGIRDRLQQYSLLIRLDRPVGIFLLLWPTLWALWIAAKGLPDTDVLIVFVLGVVLMRSAGCVLNDIADRRFDPHVSRTQNRPLVNGSVSSVEALIVAVSLIFIAFLLVLTMNWLTVQLAFIAAILAGIYPFMKRYTYLPQFFLGLTFGWAIPMAFAAQTGSVPQIAWLLLIANILWSVVYDTMYAMVDRKDDLKIGVKSTAILFDDADRVIIGIIQALVLLTLIMTGKQAQLGVYYYISLAIASCFFIYQLRLIWGRKPEQCMQAFLNNNWFGLTVFLGLFLDFIMNNNV
jgi:4-hydroxybenzoate polyprenyltransferase